VLLDRLATPITATQTLNRQSIQTSRDGCFTAPKQASENYSLGLSNRCYFCFCLAKHRTRGERRLSQSQYVPTRFMLICELILETGFCDGQAESDSSYLSQLRPHLFLANSTLSNKDAMMRIHLQHFKNLQRNLHEVPEQESLSKWALDRPVCLTTEVTRKQSFWLAVAGKLPACWCCHLCVTWYKENLFNHRFFTSNGPAAPWLFSKVPFQ
jgi:hypothetical protein